MLILVSSASLVDKTLFQSRSTAATLPEAFALKPKVLCMEIFKYEPEHEEPILAAIRDDPGWDMFTHEGAIDNYKKVLRKSTTYVCYESGEFAGYLRALQDDGLAIYISELFVVPACRNRSIGRSLIARVKADFKDLTVYALSDEDAYYENLGYRKLGSVYEIHA